MFDLEMILSIYDGMLSRVEKAREVLKRPMTLAEKILYSHLYDSSKVDSYKRGEDYVNFAPDRVAMQDATAQMALLQFMNAGRSKTSVPTSVHCDHLIEADLGVAIDLPKAKDINSEVYQFLKSAANKYGIGFWSAGAGIIHQEVLENYAFPGGMMVGTDSHTPNAGGLGMIAIGVGGADAVDVMAGMAWELKMAKIIGVKLTGELSGWCSAKDVILKLAGILTVKGGTNSIIEYFGSGAASLSATGKATICNMGAEVGATTSIFPYDENIAKYLVATGRSEVVEAAKAVEGLLKADSEVESEPEKYYDRVIEINLSEIEPYLNGPFTPDAANMISDFAKVVKEKGYPRKMEVGLIGSCTNSSYEDLSRAASIAKMAIDKNIEIKASLIINPGSQQVYDTAKRDGFIDLFESIGGVIMTNACGPCIGQWKRHIDDNTRPNSIVTSFNRNFAKRADGNPNTYAFVASPEMVMAMTIAGDLTFNPLTDSLFDREGCSVMLDAPCGDALPTNGMKVEDNGYVAPAADGSDIEVIISPKSERLQKLAPFAPFKAEEFNQMAMLIKVQGKCTTDHISMAGKWLKYRGHLDNISNNMLMGAVNAFNGETDKVLNIVTGGYDAVSSVARAYKSNGIGSVVFAEENYGEGSSREHAAMEPRFLNVKAIVVKSFARIHETNLKKQGVLALTFVDKDDYEKVREDDRVSILGIDEIAVGRELEILLSHSDGTFNYIKVQHTYNQLQIEWFKAGSALGFNS
ncbi:MAG: aconitate hydratase [Rikenellaceae bacterium]